MSSLDTDTPISFLAKIGPQSAAVWHALGAQTFPASHPQMHLVLRFEATRSEEGKTKNIEIHLADNDGNKMFAINAQLVVPQGAPGQPIRMNHILALNNIQFPRPGDYVFNVLIADDQKAAVELKLVQAKADKPVPPG